MPASLMGDFNPYGSPNFAASVPRFQPYQLPHQLDRVKGVSGAQAFPTAPNSMYALFDEDEDIMYIKRTDSANYPTITKYRFTIEEDAHSDSGKYVTIDEFNKFKEEVLNGKQFIQSSNKSNKRSNERNSTTKNFDADGVSRQ